MVRDCQTEPPELVKVSEASGHQTGEPMPVPLTHAFGNYSDQQLLDHGGDRRLNRALHIAALVRMRDHEETHSYAQRRTCEGKTLRSIRRQIKRYLTRTIYKLLTRTNARTPTT